MNRNWIIASVTAVLLAGCGSSQPGPGGDGLPPESGAPTACRVPLPERLGTRTLQKGPDSCDVHYVFTNQAGGNVRMAVNGDLRIEAGTVLEFDENTVLSIDESGSLNAIGTSTEPVVFRGAQATHGYWYGICFDNNRESTLDHVHILHGGNIWSLIEGPVCEGAISGAAPGNGEPVRISNSLIRGSAVSGIDGSNLNLGEFRDNVIADNHGFPVRIQAQHASSLDASNDFTGAGIGLPNGDDRVFLWGTLNDSNNEHTWANLGVPWYVGESGHSGYGTNVNVMNDTTLRIQADSHFEFGPGSSLNVWDGSRLLIQGRSGAPVILEGVEQTAGYWEGLWFWEAGDSELDHVEIRWAGGPGLDDPHGDTSGAVNVNLSSLVMRQSIIHGSGSCAVFIANALHPDQADDLDFEVQEHDSGQPELCGDV